MNKHGLTLLFILSVFCLLCSCRAQTEGAASLGDIEVREKNKHNLEAMGAELDPHFFSQNLTRNDGSSESDWQCVVDRVKMMNLQKIRVMVQPQWFEPVNDNDDPHTTATENFTFDSQEMQSLYKVLDLAQDQNMDVCIVLWGCPRYVDLIAPQHAHVKASFMANLAETNWITGPTDYDEWAENFVTLIKHLIRNKAYTCIKEITPMNEPDGGPLLTSEEYVKMAKILDQRFKHEGIRDKVRFNLSDNTDTRTFYLQDCATHLQNEADIFNSHTYIFGYETPNHVICDWEKNNVNISDTAGKKHLIGEFGSNQCVGASRQKDIDRYERGILMSRLVLNFLNAGAAGVSYWSLIDQYYGRNEDYQQMQQLGMWKYVREAYKPDTAVYNNTYSDYEVRPQYYAYTLLTRFLTPDSEIYPLSLNSDFVAATAFKNKSGKWTYVVVNGSDKEESFNIVNKATKGSFDVYCYQKESLPEDDSLIEKNDIKAKTIDNALHVVSKPQTVTLYHQQ